MNKFRTGRLSYYRGQFRGKSRGYASNRSTPFNRGSRLDGRRGGKIKWGSQCLIQKSNNNIITIDNNEPCSSQITEPCSSQITEPCSNQINEPCSSQINEPCSNQDMPLNIKDTSHAPPESGIGRSLINDINSWSKLPKSSFVYNIIHKGVRPPFKDKLLALKIIEKTWC